MTTPKVFEDVFASAVDVGGGLPHDVKCTSEELETFYLWNGM